MDRASGHRAAIVTVAVLMMAMSASPAFAQCAMCRRALMSPEGQKMVAAFRSGIVVLLAAPFSVFAVIAALVVRVTKRRRAVSSGDAPQPSTARQA